VRSFLPPSAQMSSLKQIVRTLNEGPTREKTRLAPILHHLAERIAKRALIIVLSDLFDDVADLIGGLKHMRHNRHEVVLLHILDRAELGFPFQEAILFRGLEQSADLLTDPRSVRGSYIHEMEGFVTELRRSCSSQNIDYVQLITDSNLGVALSSYLSHRMARAK
jgi:hypothetical protein